MDERSEGATDFETFLADLSTRFSGLPAELMDAEIEQALRNLVEFLGTDRATLFEFSASGASLRPTHSWARPPVEPYTNPVMRAASPWYYEHLLRGETMRFERLPDEVPEEAPKDLATAIQAGIKSILTIPIAVGGRFVSALSTGAFREYRTWSNVMVARVRTVGQILASAIHRRRVEADLLAHLAEIRRLRDRVEAENVYLREEVGHASGCDGIVGRSPAIQNVLALVAQVAPTSATVLLLGETGTGKELLARAIHERSPRRNRMLVKVNCAALPPTLIESELFGHEKGSFTGATATRHGRFELADGGRSSWTRSPSCPWTCSPSFCASSGTASSNAWAAPHKVDERIIAATNRDLVRAASERRFRDDLYYRLAEFPIRIPPLRERRDDIPLLVWSVIDRRRLDLGRPVERVPKRVMNALVSYAWPGNVRELEDVIGRALILSPGSTLQLEEPLAAATRPAADRLDEIERAHILRVLEGCGWRINGKGNAATVLGLEPSTLRSRMQKLGIRRPAGP
jgi:formate hydrogenlyase transcriptional activator